jgi:hypothetical protein
MILRPGMLHTCHLKLLFAISQDFIRMGTHKFVEYDHVVSYKMRNYASLIDSKSIYGPVSLHPKISSRAARQPEPETAYS